MENDEFFQKFIAQNFSDRVLCLTDQLRLTIIQFGIIEFKQFYIISSGLLHLFFL